MAHKLKNFDDVIQRRRVIASLYQNYLGDVEESAVPNAPGAEVERFDTFQNYELEAERRDELKTHLQNTTNIGTLIQWGGTAIHQFRNLWV